MIEVYGQSDDILVLDGAPYPADEIGCYNSNVMVSFSDGTVIEAGYPKYGKAVWWIQVRKKGTAQQMLNECDDEDAEIYSDVFLIDAELSRWEVMQNNKEDNNIPVMFYPQAEGITPTVVAPNTDCISRQYLVEKAVSWDKHFADGIRYVALTDILNAPSVMREATQEEREGVDQYIDSIAEPCEDAISRQSVWDVMQELWGTSGELIDRLMTLPPVTPAPKTGRWIWRTKYWNWVCSECDENPTRGTGYTPNNMDGYKYCPNCGAKMEVE